MDTIYDGGALQSRIVSYHSGGQIRQLRMTSSLFTDAEGNPAGITIVLSDLSELMELKDSLKAMEKISALNRQLNARNELLSKTFGQFLSDEIVSELLDTPGAAEPGGKKRTVTVMMSDLRGFTAMSERMDADIHITMQNDLPEKLDQPVPICFYRIDGKHVMETPCYRGITAAGSDCAILETDTQLELLDNLQISVGGRLLCKVMDKKDRGYLIQYTAVPSGYDQWIHAHITGKTAGKNK